MNKELLKQKEEILNNLEKINQEIEQSNKDYIKKIENNIVKKIIDLRKKNNITQKDLSIVLNCTRTTICTIEKNQQKISIKQLILIAMYFEKDISYFFEIESKEKNE